MCATISLLTSHKAIICRFMFIYTAEIWMKACTSVETFDWDRPAAAMNLGQESTRLAAANTGDIVTRFRAEGSRHILNDAMHNQTGISVLL